MGEYRSCLMQTFLVSSEAFFASGKGWQMISFFTACVITCQYLGMGKISREVNAKGHKFRQQAGCIVVESSIILLQPI